MKRQLRNLERVEVMGKFNGATGNYNAHIIAYPNVDWFEISRILVEDHLGLNWQPVSTQIESHDYVSEMCDTVARMNTIIIDLCRDFWMYIMRGVLGLRTIAGEVGSSTMPHKVNPIDFENAEGNCGVAISMLHHFSTKLPISRMQRDLTDSTVQRAVGSAFAHTIIAIDSTIKGLSKVMVSAPIANRELEDHWAVTGEAVQTVMRRYGLERP
ncbi:adenylosuccinate lyase, putative [Perkinsus marinus ATCC 50983]|uniref:Adenylosuccinate lyase, putative n=1 Tax=Perkinsus marinus (strain ATCC 50983 / TXsc) TaxID=423536 RepID=C5LLK1_PERM5|nr:adenylosuccinate lyase, putative [Perkinsus marinus ATCC 50983]EER02392.1 adenylosuccinate lyase, putative [Perkinsus marinus ATCC 50983]|eukprot:XP_002769674.1 adenylosuccinate lyase, putative [Perkinsus marinus ATCC 50983]